MTTLRSIDARIAERHLLKHPFYRAWSQGGISLPTLARYAREYYHFESNFPRYVGGTYARMADPRARRLLLENLTDEEGRDPTHPALWADFASRLGVPRAALGARPPRGATADLCRTYERLTVDGTGASGLGALYAYESIFPEVAAEKSRGLRAHYGIQEPAAHEFFRVHTSADVEHSRAERRVLKALIERSPLASRQALHGVDGALGGWWRFLDSFGVTA